MRRTAEEVSLNVAYRWFLGYRLQEETPHFSTISYNFRHRFTTETVDREAHGKKPFSDMVCDILDTQAWLR